MTRNNVLIILATVIGTCWAVGVHADDKSAADKATVDHVDKHKKKMRMDEPMTTGMMKKGMMKGDVKSAADKKAKDMKPTVEQEEKSMPPNKQ